MDSFIAKTYAGLEEILGEELSLLGASDVVKGYRAVYFKGDRQVMYKANLYCRYALRVLKEEASFQAPDEKSLYDGVRSIDWSRYMNEKKTLAVDAVLSQSNLNHTQYAALKTKDAIVDQFRDKTGSRPSVDVMRPDLRIHLHIRDNKATVSFDSSGDSLHKRGYRSHQAAAPLSEVLAAGMITLSGWDRKTTLLDPFCGSGTLLIEAAMIAGNVAPGIFHEWFGFQSWNDYDESLWKSLVAEARKQETPDAVPSIIGCDISDRVVSFARENAAGAGMLDKIRITTSSFFNFKRPDEGPVFIVTNPPYGERITPEDLFSLYKEIGNTLKREYAGCTAWILSGNREAEKFVGLKPGKKINLWNGPLECRFLKFEMYQGTRRRGVSSD